MKPTKEQWQQYYDGVAFLDKTAKLHTAFQRKYWTSLRDLSLPTEDRKRRMRYYQTCLDRLKELRMDWGSRKLQSR